MTQPASTATSNAREQSLAEYILIQDLRAGHHGLVHPNLEWRKAVDLAKENIDLKLALKEAAPQTDSELRLENRRLMEEILKLRAIPSARASHPDSVRLDWLEKQGNGLWWIARQSTTGRGFRLHQDPHGDYATAREAIDAHLPEAK